MLARRDAVVTVSGGLARGGGKLSEKLEQLKSLKVEVLSEDGSLRAVYDANVGMAVEIGPAGLDGHTRASLASVLETSVMELRRRGFEESRRLMGQPVPEPPSADAGREQSGSWLARERRRRAVEALNELEVVVSGKSGVRAIFAGDGDVVFDLGSARIGASDREDARLFEDLSRLIRKGQSELRSRMADIRRDIDNEMKTERGMSS